MTRRLRLSHRAGTRRVPPVLRSRFPPVFVSFSFSYHSAPFSIVKRLTQSHYISRHTHTHTLGRGLTRSQQLLYSPFAPLLPLRDPGHAIGHISDHSRTHSVDTPSTLHYQSVCTRRTNVSTPQQTILPVAIILFGLRARPAGACMQWSQSLASHSPENILLGVALFPVFRGHHCMSLRTIKLTP